MLLLLSTLWRSNVKLGIRVRILDFEILTNGIIKVIDKFKEKREAEAK